jgi:hypothetical protein
MTSHTLDRYQSCVLRLAIAIEEGCLDRAALPPKEAQEITNLAAIMRSRAKTAAIGRREDAIELQGRDGSVIETIQAENDLRL